MSIAKLISTGKILAIAVLVLGIIHDIATFTPLLQYGLSCLTTLDLNAVIYMSLVCGTSLVLSGLLIYVQLGKIEAYPFLASSIMILGIFLALTGVFSVFFMFQNPFAWIALILNVSIFVVINRIRQLIAKTY